MMKVAIIGAGNVGSTVADRVLAHNLADVVLVDIMGDLAKGKALDLGDASPLMGYETRVLGTGEYRDIKDSTIVVITAGFPRKEGMSREELTSKNIGIVRTVLENIRRFSPDAILIMVTNPLDIMTWLAHKEMRRERTKIMGMAGNLDTARFKFLLSSELGVPAAKIETFVLGSHGDTMVPLISRTLVQGKPLGKLLDKKKIDALVERTKNRGGEIVTLLKSGSAYFSPAAACFELISAIVKDEKKLIPCSCVLEGEYGIENTAIGVPAKIGRKGVLKILEWKLPHQELSALRDSAKAVIKGQRLFF